MQKSFVYLDNFILLIVANIKINLRVILNHSTTRLQNFQYIKYLAQFHYNLIETLINFYNNIYTM